MRPRMRLRLFRFCPCVRPSPFGRPNWRHFECVLYVWKVHLRGKLKRGHFKLTSRPFIAFPVRCAPYCVVSLSVRAFDSPSAAKHVLWCKLGPLPSMLQHHFLIEPFDLWLIPLISSTIFPTDCSAAQMRVWVLRTNTNNPPTPLPDGISKGSLKKKKKKRQILMFFIWTGRCTVKGNNISLKGGKMHRCSLYWHTQANVH